MNNKHLIGILVLTLTFAACGRHRQADALLGRADSLMASRPDAAYALLDSVRDEARGTWGRADRMRYELTLAEAMNKAYVPFTTDSVMKRVARYYDRHGSANQQLKAHYLLGCTYRDMGEAPAAINAWQEAVEKADTTSADCDYTTFFSIYGQMASVFQAQQLTTMEIEAYRNYSKFAKLAGDIYEYIRGIELMIIPFYQQQDTANVFALTEKARNLYLHYGMTEAAARVYPTAISVAVQYGLYDRALAMMKIFEKESGLFDSEHHIDKNYELYYQSKGLYYLGVGQPDSAEWYFRMLSSDGYQVEGYRGLLLVYQARQLTDSIIRYTKLHEAAVFTMMSAIDAQATGQAASLFDYNRNEKIASLKTKEASHFRKVLALVIMATFVIGLLSWLAYRQFKKRKEKEAHRLLIQYQDSQKQASSLEEELVAAQERFSKLKVPEREEQLKNTDIVKLFRTIIKPQQERQGTKLIIQPARIASEEEWEKLRVTIQQHLPTFYAFITTERRLTKQQHRICMLFRIGFTGEEIATILGTPPSRVSTVKKSLNAILFIKSDISLFFDNLKNL